MSNARLQGLALPCLLLAGISVTGCASVGNYLGNRARDLGECFALEVGFAPATLCVDVKAAGLAHASLGWGGMRPNAAVGWIYGHGRPLTVRNPRREGDIGLVLFHSSTAYLDGRPYGHGCFGLLPGIFSMTGPEPNTPREGFGLRGLWDGRANRAEDRWARIHVFDVEAGVYALAVGARAGFSPGELLDFLLGWFGVDIAGDDRILESEEEEEEEPREGELFFDTGE